MMEHAMNISLDGHHGQQCREDYTVYFYGLYFDTKFDLKNMMNYT